MNTKSIKELLILHFLNDGVRTAFVAGSLAGRYFLGRGVDKLGNTKVFILSEILMAASLILLTFLNSFFLILIISILVGMFTKGTAPVIQTMMSEVSHKMHYDKIYALSELFLGFAAMITIILMGALADKLGIYFVFYASSALAIIAIIPILLLSKSKTV